MSDEWNKVDEAAAALKKRFGPAPEICAVLGSGLGAVADDLADRKTVPAEDLPHWPVSAVAGHAGAVHVGALKGTPVLILAGRVHLYEGLSAAEVTRPVRAAVTWGAKSLLLTNAAGAISSNLEPGELMVFEDHLNFTGHNPLAGLADVGRGARFPDLSQLYNPELRDAALECATRLGVRLTPGVYGAMLGPSYETPAEVRHLAAAGADAVGMSTVPEAIAAGHLGARVAAFSCLTNRAAGLPGAILDHEHVQRIGNQASAALARLIAELIVSEGG